jgi:hypothetical protein
MERTEKAPSNQDVTGRYTTSVSTPEARPRSLRKGTPFSALPWDSAESEPGTTEKGKLRLWPGSDMAWTQDTAIQGRDIGTRKFSVMNGSEE